MNKNGINAQPLCLKSMHLSGRHDKIAIKLYFTKQHTSE